MKPEMLSVRAVNQYRYRDTIAYLGLRYYLDNDCAKRDIWAKDITNHLIQTRSSPIYFKSNHFKEIADNGSIIHRSIYLPGPNEIMAEAFLLHYCSTQTNFQSAQCVYSYRFPAKTSKESIFSNYFPGFQERNKFIKKACGEGDLENTKVLFTDIRKFYPSIPHYLALEAWTKACESTSFSAKVRTLGERILSDHQNFSRHHQEESGILTGPMFSHLIANLLLSDLDKFMSKSMNHKYCRYVDDFVLIGSAEEVKAGRNLLEDRLRDLGLHLHNEEKDFEINAADWICCEDEFNTRKPNLWNNLVANIKRFLVVNPYAKGDLERAFSSEGINLPLLDYSVAVSESSYLEKLSDWINRYSWASELLGNLSISNLLKSALEVRDSYGQELNSLLEKGINSSKYQRKIFLSRIKFYSKRIAYLATSEDLLSFSLGIEAYPELISHAMIMKSVYSRDISELVKYGADAAQCVAQILGIQPCRVTCHLKDFSEAELQSLAIFRFHEVDVELDQSTDAKTKEDLLNQFALYMNTDKLMLSDNLFIQELACLRGLENPITHKKMLNTAFDRNEELSFSIIDQLNGSSYF
jgi:hypothetical protein